MAYSIQMKNLFIFREQDEDGATVHRTRVEGDAIGDAGEPPHAFTATIDDDVTALMDSAATQLASVMEGGEEAQHDFKVYVLRRENDEGAETITVEVDGEYIDTSFPEGLQKKCCKKISIDDDVSSLVTSADAALVEAAGLS